MKKMLAVVTKHLALMGLGLTLTVGCGGPPEESTPPLMDLPAAASPACPITGCDNEPPEDNYVEVTLKCEIDVWNGIRITNTSAYNVPSNVRIQYKFITYTSPVYGSTWGPLAKGQSIMVPAYNDNAIVCRASAEWSW